MRLQPVVVFMGVLILHSIEGSLWGNLGRKRRRSRSVKVPHGFGDSPGDVNLTETRPLMGKNRLLPFRPRSSRIIHSDDCDDELFSKSYSFFSRLIIKGYCDVMMTSSESILVEGRATVRLPCEFEMVNFSMFQNPIIWNKRQAVSGWWILEGLMKS